MTVKFPNILLMRRLGPILLGLVCLLGFAAVAHGSSVIKGPKGFKTSQSTLEFIGGFEGFYSKPYNDPAGFATVGYGHLIAYRPVNKSDRGRIWVKGQKKKGQLTRKEGLRLLRKDLKGYEEAIFDRIGNTPISPSMMTALTSFTFNLGAGYLDRRRAKKRFGLKATNIKANIRRGKYRLAANQMRQFDGVISGNRRYTLPGLTRRRKAERRLMIKGIDELKNCPQDCKPQQPPDSGNSGGVPSP